MNIRTFIENDRAALRELYLESRKRTFHWLDCGAMKLEDFDHATEGELIRVAADASIPVGFISIWEPDNFLHNLFVHPDRLGNGIGTALLRAGLDEIGRPATLKCMEPNSRARRFYETRGWQVTSVGESPDGRYHLMTLANR